MNAERLVHEVNSWHAGHGSRRTPDYWPSEATLCAIPQEHHLVEKGLQLKGQKVSLTVHHCTKCAFSLTVPTVEKEGKK